MAQKLTYFNPLSAKLNPIFHLLALLAHHILHVSKIRVKQRLFSMPIPVAARSKASVCGRSLAGIAGSNPAGALMFVCCECCVFTGRGLCDVPITHP